MRLFHLAVTLLGLVWGAVATSNGLTDLVTWDSYSLSVNGDRTYIYSAEFHYQRMPVPELWPDILQKFKANGFNAISVYFFWSYHSASEGVYDFETSGKNIQRLFDYAKEAGLWVIARAGPYCNAETNGGGLALWGSDGSMGVLRTADETYQEAWLPWITQVGEIIAANQITEGGPVILNQVENEYQENDHSPNATAVLHMIQIEEAFRDAGIVVPLTHNEKGMRSQSWSVDYQDVGGAVDIYGLDSYPGGLSCTNPTVGFNVNRLYYQWFQNYSYTQPEYVPEFEGGWFSAWGGGTFYDQCVAEHDPAFADVYYKNNIGQKITLHNIYMTWGGTNWGHSAAPVVYTSYDYSAPLRETRQQWNKLFQTKLVGLFTRVSSDLLKADMVGNGTGYSLSSNAAFSWVLRNPDTGATFTVVQQATTSSFSNISFSASLNTSAGAVTVPNVELYGRQSKIITTDYNFGSHSLLYSSADIAVYGVFDVDVIVMYLKEGQTGSFALKSDKKLSYKIWGASTFAASGNSTTASAFNYKQAAGTTVVKFLNGVVAYLLDQPTAWRLWAPPTTLDPAVAPHEQILVIGPYLVRDASVKLNTLYINGDNDDATTLEAYTGTAIDTIVWNGQSIEARKTAYGSYKADIPGAESREISLPALTAWKSADSLPEAQPAYDDSKWKVCDKTTTRSPVAPETLPVLFSSDYGYYAGTKVYRGYFDGANSSAVYISASGGLGFGWNAWLNGKLIGGHPGDGSFANTNATLALPSSALKAKGNVITVVVDYHGHDETSTAKGVENPRGILGSYLLPSGTAHNTGFTLWKIQGNAGGDANIDPVRGPMNEGGLYGERLGWHLPGFNPNSNSNSSSSKFDASGPTTGLSKSGIRFYATDFELDLDDDLDVPLGVELPSPAGTVARVMIWINGYQYGKYVPHLGPQTRFPIPPGVINNKGKNTMVLSLWAQTEEGAKLDEVKLFSYGQYQTSFKFSQDWSYLQPGWENREQYA
ncbi:glycoside hydrolase superfamily [Pseudomassariella vexata]|uniref:Beta-galactosidase n=1 Tax=Pseudomassariella vexata TaxID=1141098 RepID=A0A1Y2EH22_9PEZI|nr:glycoside hydrolase superfamily [Pseudomassariella vexata]ORY70085.1 glycoside hydrolase superfamily [Pseudomassariella vexata]